MKKNHSIYINCSIHVIETQVVDHLTSYSNEIVELIRLTCSVGHQNFQLLTLGKNFDNFNLYISIEKLTLFFCKNDFVVYTYYLNR